MSGRIHESVVDEVLVVELDNPPVNASSQPLRAGLIAALDRLATDPSLIGAVLVGANGAFVAGSDISEFDGDVPAPLLPAVIAAIERCPKPVIAALDGVALGGGFELALGCDARIASPGVHVGLPEVTLGIVPGAGGTQRLPRLVGRPTALEMILTGRRVDGQEAHRRGIVDELVEGDLRSAAVRYATSARKRRLIDLPVPPEESDLDEVAARTIRGARRPNADVAIELVRSAGVVGSGIALARERAVFEELRIAPEARAQRHLFFAERAAPRRAGVTADRDPVARVGIVGAGSMGTSIATAFALAGTTVQLIDTDADAARRGLESIRVSLEKEVSRGRLTPDAATEWSARVTAATDCTDLSDADLVIEAVIEDPEVKASVLRMAEAHAPHAVLATNTSYLSVGELAAAIDDPGRMIGMHFFNPADVMKLVEIIPGSVTSDATLGRALGIARALGKTAVIAGDREGFIGNRMFSAYRRHAEYLLEDGASPDQVDEAMEVFGFAMGPFAVADLSGLQIAQSLRQRWRESGRLPARYVDIPDLLCERGRLGRRTGRGYYRYDGGRSAPDPEVQAIVEAESARKGIERRDIAADEIVRRLMGALIVEGAQLVREGTARHIDDIDVAAVGGFGFPRFVGGPMWWARQKDACTLDSLAAAVAAAAHEDISDTPLSEGIARD